MKSIAREASIPNELAAFPDAEFLWPKILRRATPHYLAQFGIRDLVFRLACQEDRECRNGGRRDVWARAAIWRHVAEQCAEGKGEIPSATEEALRYWTPGGERKPQRSKVFCSNCSRPMRVSPDSPFSSCRTCRGEARRTEKVTRAFNRTGELLQGWKLCERCNTPFESSRKDGRYCGNKCRQRASRENRQNGVSVRPGVTDKGILGVVTH